MRVLAERHLSPRAIEDAGLLSAEGVAALFDQHEAPDTTPAARNTLDALFNHLIGVQVLHERLVACDVPALARARAKELGWTAR